MRLVDVGNVECTRLQFKIYFVYLILLSPFCALASQPAERMVPRLKGYLNSPYGYWEYLPYNYETESRLPVVIYLHGIKETGDGESVAALEKIALNGVPYIIRRFQREFPFILIAPQSPGLHEGFAAEGLDELIEIIKSNYKIDNDRIYITGISYGAYAALRLASYVPEKLAAIVPFSSCGGQNDVKKLKDVPMWAFANVGDKHDIPACMEQLVENIRDNGGTPLLTLYPRKGHNAWERTYKNNDMWEWLLKQRRGQRDENHPPMLIHPGNKIVGIGSAARYTIMASDRNNDSLTFKLNGSLKEGSRFLIHKNGYAELFLNTLVPGIFKLSVIVQDGKGGSAIQNFYLQTSYTLLLLPYFLLTMFQPFILELPLISIFILLILMREFTTRFFQLIIRFFPWLFVTALVTFEV